jgi:hypothetical protein
MHHLSHTDFPKPFLGHYELCAVNQRFELYVPAPSAEKHLLQTHQFFTLLVDMNYEVNPTGSQFESYLEALSL